MKVYCSQVKVWKKNMLYVRPNYYKNFSCIADRCEATCCAGWQIVIDEESLERYEQEKGSYGEILSSRVDWEEGVFLQDEKKRCAFLDANNLCDMYKNLGENSLCKTCTNYPRHIEEFENIREITLSISCPEVARIILGTKDPVSFYEEFLEEEEEEFEGFDPFFFSYLEDAREVLLKILQNRSLDLSVRVALARELGAGLQETLETEDLFDLADVIEKYEEEAYLQQAITEIKKEIQTYHKSADESFAYSKAVFGKLYELEYLAEDWSTYLEECWGALYDVTAEEYRANHEQFRQWSKTCDLNLEVMLEQLCVYFVFTYFCGAVYDDDIMGKMELSFRAVFHIYEMWIAKWLLNGKLLGMDDIVPIVYRYSRELEHSDINLEVMEQI